MVVDEIVYRVYKKMHRMCMACALFSFFSPRIQYLCFFLHKHNKFTETFELWSIHVFEKWSYSRTLTFSAHVRFNLKLPLFIL